MDTLKVIAIVLAVVVLLLGLGLHFWSVSARGRANFHTTTNFAWLLMALFPVLILFTLFPESEVTITRVGLKAGGTVALFLLIWIPGRRSSWAGRSLDELEHKIGELDTEKRDLTDELKKAQATEPVLLGHAAYSYSIDGAPGKSLAVITGDLMDVRDCDCWVNSENNYMLMSRPFEKSISAVIRYYGARRDAAGDMEDDLIADQLRDAVGGAKVVAAGSVFLTSAGELKKSHGVKVIAHVASVTGQVGVGWKPIDNIHLCVRSVLDAVKASDQTEEVESVLFPLMGTGQAGGSRERWELVRVQMEEAVRYLAINPKSKVKRVCFVAWSAGAFEACKRAITSLPNVHEDAG